MFCGKCGSQLDANGICLNCTNVSNEKTEVITDKKRPINNKIIFIIIGVVVVLVIGFLIFKMVNKSERSETLTNLEKNEYLKFKIGEQEFYLGDKVSTYQNKNYGYDENNVSDNAYVPSDSIISQTFYNNEDEAQFIAAMYCEAGNECQYEDTVLVKINFYENSDVVINDYLKFGMKYNDVVKQYGEEDGKFYQNEKLLVWTFGEKGKIGEPYYIIRFDDSGLFSTGKINEIRIGVWWYEGEYEHTVIKNSSEVTK